MELPNFHPGTTAEQKSVQPIKKKTGQVLLSIAQWLLVMVTGLLPLLFLPNAYVPVTNGKFILFLGGLFLAVLLFVFFVLRNGTLSFRLPWPIIGIWSVVVVSTVAAFSAGDLADSLWGNMAGQQTVAFTWGLAILMTATGIIAGSRRSLVRVYSFLYVVALVLSSWHLARLVFGPETLSFGIFTSATATTLGGWNSLAIFYGLVVLLALFALQQLALTKFARVIVIATTALALAMLALINFVTVWYFVATVSGLLLLYNLLTAMWQTSDSDSKVTWLTAVLAGFVFAVSLAFLVFGSYLGDKISAATDISFLEVRPSFTATVDIARTTFSESALFGVGPNRFADVWRLHKDPSINQTIFWNTEFTSGYSFLTTNAIETGLLGVAAWLFFLASFLWYGWRFVATAYTTDKFWYFTGLSSLISSVYFWLMAAFYVPSGTILLLAALTSGMFLVAFAKLIPGRTITISVERHRAYGLLLVVLSVLVVSGGAIGIYTLGKQSYSIYVYNKANIESQSISELENKLTETFGLFANDTIARELAFYQWSQMRDLLSSGDADSDQQLRFRELAERGLNAAATALELDPTDPRNHQTQGQIYAILAVAGLEGAKERALQSFATAASHDPQNPTWAYLKADLYASLGETELARQAAEESLKVRPNHTDAIFLLAQLDINAGELDQAVNKVAALVQLEPQNPARRYQLGLLLSGAGRLEEAVVALEQAVQLDPQYANARYYLALAYAEQGQTTDAIEQLTIVRDLNESNATVNELINTLAQGGSLSSLSSDKVDEREPSEESITADDLENDLITSPNPVRE